MYKKQALMTCIFLNMTQTNDMATRKPGYGFYVLLAAVSALMLVTVLPYLEVFVLALIVAIVTSPLYDRLLRWTKWPGLASGLSVLIVALLIIVPLYLFVILAIGQFISFTPLVQEFFATHSVKTILSDIPMLKALLPGADFNNFVQSSVVSSVDFLKQLVVPFATTTAYTIINVVIFLFMLVFMYPVKDAFIEYLKDIVPLDPDESDTFVDRLVVTANTTIKSSFAAAFVQAALSLIGYLATGIPAPLFWLFAVFIASLLPFGSGIINVPIIVGLFVSGNVFPALVLLVWQIVVVSNADNIVRISMLKRSTVQLPELLTLLATIGGIVTFGFFGIIFGPLIAVMFVFMLELYKKVR